MVAYHLTKGIPPAQELTMSLDLTKHVQLSDGTPVRIISTDKKGSHSVVALIRRGANDEYIQTFPPDGVTPGFLRLVNVTEKRKAVVYYDHKNELFMTVWAYSTREINNNLWKKVAEFEVEV
jgi:hypothetical protein